MMLACGNVKRQNVKRGVFVQKRHKIALSELCCLMPASRTIVVLLRGFLSSFFYFVSETLQQPPTMPHNELNFALSVFFFFSTRNENPRNVILLAV